MKLIRKYLQKQRLKDQIYFEFESSLQKKDYNRVGQLIKRYLRVDKP
jgi:hypothetical protein